MDPPRSAATLVTATPFGESSPCVTYSNNLQLNRIYRTFIASILAFLSIGLQNYLFSASASSLARKLRTLSWRGILRQDSKSVSGSREVMMSSQVYS